MNFFMYGVVNVDWVMSFQLGQKIALGFYTKQSIPTLNEWEKLLIIENLKSITVIDVNQLVVDCGKHGQYPTVRVVSSL